MPVVRKLVANKLVIQSHVNLKDFSAIMANLYLNGCLNIAVAVSGGSDSLCLAILLNSWAKISNAKITALIVNHGLRKNIEDEITKVQSWLQYYNINNKVLNVAKINPTSKVQQNAREARYQALFNYCKQNNIAYLCTAHHFNDLLETIKMRQARPGNIWGDAGVSFIKNYGSVLLFRPLLFFTKTTLQNTLIKLKQAWVEDPSNQNLNFERVTLRKQLGEIDNNHILHFLKEINILRQQRIKLEKACLKFLVNEVTISQLGAIVVKLKALNKLKAPTKIAVLGLLIKFCSNKAYMPKLTKIKYLLEQLKLSVTKKDIQKFTLGGVIIIKSSIRADKKSKLIKFTSNNTTLTFIKEARVIKEQIQTAAAVNNSISWDKRFLISKTNILPQNYYFAKIAVADYNTLYSKEQFKNAIRVNNLGRELVLSLPWLFDENKKPVPIWLISLLGNKNVTFFPKNSLFQDLFYNFTIAKTHHLD